MCGIPVDTGRKLNVHKTFRRRRGHLLNVNVQFTTCVYWDAREKWPINILPLFWKPNKCELLGEIDNYFRTKLSKHEGGFQKEFNYGYSLLSIFEKWKTIFGVNGSSGSFLTDVPKAFDSLVCDLSSSKVRVFGLDYVLLKLIWIRLFACLSVLINLISLIFQYDCESNMSNCTYVTTLNVCEPRMDLALATLSGVLSNGLKLTVSVKY